MDFCAASPNGFLRWFLLAIRRACAEGSSGVCVGKAVARGRLCLCKGFVLLLKARTPHPRVARVGQIRRISKPTGEGVAPSQPSRELQRSGGAYPHREKTGIPFGERIRETKSAKQNLWEGLRQLVQLIFSRDP